ncbi:hypothetical protein ACS0TW_00565, partial [Klebsiella michiganensis]
AQDEEYRLAQGGNPPEDNDISSDPTATAMFGGGSRPR